MVRIGVPAATKQTRLLGNKSDVVAFTKVVRLGLG
jgi:hypothetical protein